MSRITKVTLPRPNIRAIEVDSINVDPEYQRKVNKDHVQKMYDEYRGLDLNQVIQKLSDSMGTLCVGVRDDKSMWAVDGQQRMEVARMLKNKLGLQELDVYCECFLSEGPEHESKVYNKRNHRKDMTPCEKFKGRLAAADREAAVVNRTLEQYGIGVSGVDYPNPVKRISCIGACEKVHRIGRGRLAEAIEVLGTAWAWSNFLGGGVAPTFKKTKDAKDAFKGSMIVGVGIFLDKNPGVDKDSLRRCLSKTSPSNIYKAAARDNEAAGLSSGYGRDEMIAKKIGEVYARKLAKVK